MADAIAYCCPSGMNCREFGKLGVITPLVTYTKSKDKKVLATTAHVLQQLSADPHNCVMIHDSGVMSVSIMVCITIAHATTSCLQIPTFVT